jgi:hypothetical protein
LFVCLFLFVFLFYKILKIKIIKNCPMLLIEHDYIAIVVCMSLVGLTS